MDLAIIIISISVMVAMILLRHYEIKHQKVSPISNFLHRSNKPIVKSLAELKVSVKHNFHHGRVYLVNYVVFHSSHLVQKTGTCIHELSKKTADFLRGKHMFKNKGGVSFFLKNISEMKNEVKDEIKREVEDIERNF